MVRLRTALAIVPCLLLAAAQGSSAPDDQWRADHHMHLASADLCSRIDDCLAVNTPVAVYAADAVRALDQAHVRTGVILSCAYIYGMTLVHLPADSLAYWVRKENEFTAEQVSKFPKRLVGFLSVDPLDTGAVAEVRHWRGNHTLVGLKLHFFASRVDVRDSSHVRMVNAVIRQAAAQQLPFVIHVGGGDFAGPEAETFIRDILPNAGKSWVQIAHAGGGGSMGHHLEVLTAFADHIAANDPATRHLLFDLSYVPGPKQSDETAAALAVQIRRIGLDRFVFGSDFDVQMPDTQIGALARLGLTPAELRALRSRCAPWACR